MISKQGKRHTLRSLGCDYMCGCVLDENNCVAESEHIPVCQSVRLGVRIALIHIAIFHAYPVA